MELNNWDFDKLIEEDRVFPRNQLTAGGVQKYYVKDADFALELMVDHGFQLVHKTTVNALWFETTEGGWTQFMCNWNIKRRLLLLGAIEECGNRYPFTYYEASKVGKKLRVKTKAQEASVNTASAQLDKIINESITSPEVDTPVVERHENVSHETKEDEDQPEWWPKTFAVYRDKDRKNISGTGIVIHGVVFEGGKTVVYWNSSKCISIFDSYSKFEDVHLSNSEKHGSSVVIWSKDKTEKKAEKTEMLGVGKFDKNDSVIIPRGDWEPCYYCKKPLELSRKGAKPWRYHCKKGKCASQYRAELKIKRELDDLEDGK